MADISKIQVGNTTYNLKDINTDKVVYKESSNFKVIRNCRTVCLNVFARSITLAVGWNTIGTVDYVYRPYYTTIQMAMNYDAANAQGLPMIMRVALDGKIEIYAYSAGTYSPYATATYLSGN